MDSTYEYVCDRCCESIVAGPGFLNGSRECSSCQMVVCPNCQWEVLTPTTDFCVCVGCTKPGQPRISPANVYPEPKV